MFFLISGAGFMFLYNFMGITFSSAPVSILKFVFVSFIYSSVDHLFCCTVFIFFSIWFLSRLFRLRGFLFLLLHIFAK